MKESVTINGKDEAFTRSGNGSYYKRIDGKLAYLGRGLEQAAEAYRKRLEALATVPVAALEPERRLSVGRLLNDFRAKCESKVEQKELKPEGLKAYLRVFEKIQATLDPKNVRLLADLTEEDFYRLALVLKKAPDGRFYAPATATQYLVIADMVLKFAADRHWIEPVKYREALECPRPEKQLKYLEERGELRFGADQIRRMIEVAQGPMRAWLFVGINAAYGPTDLEKLTRKHIDLNGGWLTFPRVKNSRPRRCPLWPETIEAIREFYPWQTTAGKIAVEFRELLDSIDTGTEENPEFPRGKNGFYSLRRTLVIVASEVARDHVVRKITGHSDKAAAGQLGTYRQGACTDDQLRQATDHVRSWLAYSG